MLEYIERASPILIPLLLYFFHLEKKITSMSTDIDWIKEFCLTSITNPQHTATNPGADDLSAQS